MIDNFEQGLTEIASKMRRKDNSILCEGPAAFVLRARDQIKMCNEENEAMAKEYDRQIAEAKESHKIAVSCALKAGRGIGRAAAQMEVIDKEEWSKVFRDQQEESCKENAELHKLLTSAVRELERVDNVKDGHPLVSHSLLYNLRNAIAK
jgi:ribosomal protein L16 Arg81 hydroxylase